MLRWLAPAAIALAAVAYAVLVIWKQGITAPGLHSADLYGAHYPSVVYALQALRDGHGLLWNRLLNCGQAFLPATLVGLLYPLNAIFLVTGVDAGFLLSAIAHLAIGGLFTYLLARELDAQPAAGACAGLAFTLGGSSLSITHWVPTNIAGPYAWMPAALFLVERLLRAPGLAAALLLGVVLTLALLPGYPQIVFFTYQLIALRVAWQLVTPPPGLRRASLAGIGLGLLVPLGLGAAYLLPAAELARLSVRSHELSLADLQPFARPTFGDFRLDGGAKVNTWLPIVTLTPTMVAAASLAAPVRWRQTAFWAAVLALYMLLALWPPAFEVYRRLPLGSVFRDPHRFLWIVSFAMAMLVGLGADALLRSAGGRAAAGLGRPGLGGRLLPGALLLLGMAAYFGLSQRPLHGWEWGCLGGLALVAALCALRGPSWGRAGAWLAPALLLGTVGANLLLAGSTPFSRRLADTQRLFGAADALAAARTRMTPLDRIYFFGGADVAFYDKAPSMMGVPAITDYEPQTQQRFADLIVWMLQGRRIERLNQFYLYRVNPIPEHWSPFHLLAARFLVLSEGGQDALLRQRPQLQPRFAQGGIAVLENPDALPRAFYVPRLEVEADPQRILSRLAEAPVSVLRETALVEAPPADGFLGEPSATPDPGAVVDFSDRSEEVRVRVRAREPGFLFLADQYYPGWEATVNGVPAPLLRANYVLRAVRVPAGDSEVVFRYRPRSWAWGWRLSLVSLALVAAGLAWSRRR
jgi:hypothetical protein